MNPIDSEAIRKFREAERAAAHPGSHLEELIEAGLSEADAAIAVRVSDRRLLPEVYKRTREAMNHFMDRLPVRQSVIYRRALFDDGTELAKDAALLRISPQALAKSVERFRTQTERGI